MAKEFPAQTKGRLVWILDTIRANQASVALILHWINGYPEKAKIILDEMDKLDRDAILQSEGIFTLEQLKGIKDAALVESKQNSQVNS